MHMHVHIHLVPCDRPKADGCDLSALRQLKDLVFYTDLKGLLQNENNLEVLLEATLTATNITRPNLRSELHCG